MWWLICVAVVVILYFFIHFKIRNEVNEIEASSERTKTFVIMGNESNEMDFPIEREINVILSNESNEIDVSKDLSISPSCNFQINGKEKIVSTDASKVKVLVVPTNEELAIARDTSALTRS